MIMLLLVASVSLTVLSLPLQIEVINDRIGMVYSGMGPDFRLES